MGGGSLRIVTENQRIVQNFKSLQTIQFDIPSVPKNNTLVQPNVYYIVLDSYLRSDVMREIYDYDNTEFINFLHQKGFYVADQAHSNYGFTYLSLNASLNYDYLTSFSKQFEKRDPNLLPLVALLRNNRVMRFFKEQGYETVLFPSGYHAVENMKADVRLFLPNTLNSFQDELIAKTPLRFGLQQLQYELQRQRITYQFKNLPAAAEGNAPRFIFAHIIAPHPPFVFQADGSPFNPDWEFMPFCLQ